MSDIHGCLNAFENALSLIKLSGNNKLILLGDYIHRGPDSYAVLEKILSLQKQYDEDRIIALLGNHETMALSGEWPINGEGFDENSDKKYLDWFLTLPRYYATKHQIFCHAGVDEDYGDMWKYTDSSIFTEKSFAQTGHFCMDIIAGHFGTGSIAGDKTFHDIYYDGKSHYYIDGTVLKSGKIPVLMVDTETNKYYQVTESGPWPIMPYGKEYY